MTRVIIYLPETERQALLALAVREYRDPRAQAALLIRRGLEAEGVLAEVAPTTEKQPNATRAEAIANG